MDMTTTTPDDRRIAFECGYAATPLVYRYRTADGRRGYLDYDLAAGTVLVLEPLS